ncbi:uncharacterized protein LOC101862911 [Aplysia californica]|uniref:Uncharacterized protein LOC101862911 n=1 Tax=Aplysia californica TaxID=6500 RepID=A0ABM0K879_APLCA|nr:uncharacterized protein LOC101862911 [Aplysia californica]
MSSAMRYDMDDEKLIATVRKHSAIYDKNDKNYNNRPFITRSWKEVAKEMGSDVWCCKGRWVTMRDYFQKKLKESVLAAASNRPLKKKRWWLFDTLSFLTPFMTMPETSSVSTVVKPPPDTEEDDEEEVEEPEDDDYGSEMLGKDLPMLDDQQSQDSFPSDILENNNDFPNPFKKPRRSGQSMADNYADLRYNIQQQTQWFLQLQKQAEKNTDENEHFFRSLLPTLRKLDDLEVMEFRHDVQGLLLKYFKAARCRKSEMANGSQS